MDERKEVVIVAIILFLIAAISIYINIFFAEFNFSKSILNINGNEISERLYYKTNKPYHTLYRNFKTQITIKPKETPKTPLENFKPPVKVNYNTIKNKDGLILINSVSCQSGTPYATISRQCYIFPDIEPIGLEGFSGGLL